jgi:hypothetical protein
MQAREHHFIPMAREIKLPRTTVGVANEAMKWSEDGYLALATGSQITILVSILAVVVN